MRSNSHNILKSSAEQDMERENIMPHIADSQCFFYTDVNENASFPSRHL